MSEAAEFTLTTSEAALRLGVHQDTVTRWAKEKRLPHMLTPGGWRKFRPRDVETFAQSMLEAS